MEAQDAVGVAHLLRIKEIAAKEGPLIDDKDESESGAGKSQPNQNASKLSSDRVQHGFGTVPGENKAEKKRGTKKGILKMKVEVHLGKDREKTPGASPRTKPVDSPASSAASLMQDSIVKPSKIPSENPTNSPPRSPQKLHRRSLRRQLATRKTRSGGTRKKRAAAVAEINADGSKVGRGKASQKNLPKHRLLSIASSKKHKTTAATLGRRTSGSRHSNQGKDGRKDPKKKETSWAKDVSVDECEIPSTEPKLAPLMGMVADSEGEKMDNFATAPPTSLHRPTMKNKTKKFPVSSGALETSANAKAGVKEQENSKPAATNDTAPALGPRTWRSDKGQRKKIDPKKNDVSLAKKSSVGERKIATPELKSAPLNANVADAADEMMDDIATAYLISQHRPTTKKNPISLDVSLGALEASADAKDGMKDKEDIKPAATSSSRRSTRSALAAGDCLLELTPIRRTTRFSGGGDDTSGILPTFPVRRLTRSSASKESTSPSRTSKAASSRGMTAKGASTPFLAKRKDHTSGVFVGDIIPSHEASRTRTADAPDRESEGRAKRASGGEVTDSAAILPSPVPSAIPTRRSNRKSVPSMKSIEATASLSASIDIPEVASMLEVEGGVLEPPACEEKKKGKAVGPAKLPASIAIDPVWEHHFDRLIKFKKENGHTMVPKKYQVDQPLSTWVFKQRQERNRYESRRRSTITIERIARLNGIGFNWRPKETDEYKRLEAARKRAITDAVWESRFQELLEFKKCEGHTLVPKMYSVNTPLAQWVHRQRTLRKKLLAGEGNPKISKEQVEKLEKVGFVWDAKQDPRFKVIEAERKRPEVEKLWEKYFKQLMQFKTQEGHCIVPKLYPTNQPLASWVAKQRQHYRLKKEGKHTNMTDQHVWRLKAEGFVFANTRRNKTFAKIERKRKRPQTEALWNERFRQLLLFKKKKGHTVVPKNYPQNPILSHWVFRQRALHRMLCTGHDSSMTEEQVRKLDRVGFVWVVRRKKDGENEFADVGGRVVAAGDSNEEDDSSNDSSTSSSPSDSDSLLSDSNASSSDDDSDSTSDSNASSSEDDLDSSSNSSSDVFSSDDSLPLSRLKKRSIKAIPKEISSLGRAEGDTQDTSESGKGEMDDRSSKSQLKEKESRKGETKVGADHVSP
mmetsp:Transcript_37585/g.112668  ORF Transcript_37585/g.112668 Transcript_37585/m.112668 type:complete len:1144 (-) Transcript_37585:315-3746(-)